MPENELTVTEQRRLQHFEQQITKGVGDIYQALRMIHDNKLYRGAHETFGDYCLARWGIGQSRAYQLLKHGQILKLIEDKDSTIVESVRESHTREVADLPPEEGAKIIVETVKKTEGKVTARAVRKTRSGSEADPFGDDDPFGDEPISPEGEEADKEGQSPRPPRNGKEKSGGSQKPDPKKEFDLQKSKTIKTCEALQRAFGDLNALMRIPEWEETAREKTDDLLRLARAWKYAER